MLVGSPTPGSLAWTAPPGRALGADSAAVRASLGGHGGLEGGMGQGPPLPPQALVRQWGGGRQRTCWLRAPPPPTRRHRPAAHLLPSHLGVAAPSLIQNVVLLSAPQVELLKQTGASGTETRSAGPCPWAARSGAGSWSVGHQRLRLRGGRAQGRASTSPEATAQGGPAPEGEAGLPRACGPHSAPTRQMQLLRSFRFGR